MNYLKRVPIVFLGCMMAFFCTTSARAGVLLLGTRIVYPSQSKGEVLLLANHGEYPTLAQVWMDLGDINTKPEDIKVPFIITPTMFRMGPETGQTIRIVYTGEDLPKDRESIFYLNVMEIPPKPKDTIQNYLQFSVRSRIKVFFRPQGLPMDSDEAMKRLQWRIEQRVGAGGVAQYVLHAHNPTPYYVNVSDAVLKFGSGSIAKTKESGMVNPNGEFDYELKDVKSVPSGEITIEYNCVNDLGGATAVKATITATHSDAVKATSK